MQPQLGGDGPLYRQLAAALRHAVDTGEIPLGTALPPERILARALAVSRSTVVAAYDTLKAQGWLASRQGSGTWVRHPEPTASDEAPASISARVFGLGPVGAPAGPERPTSAADAEVIELSVAAPDGSSAVVEAATSITVEDLTAWTATHGYLPAGLPQLRAAIARWFVQHDLETSAEQVLVTTGAHQGIAVVARQLVHRGDTVLVESPTFPGALDLFAALGVRLVPIPVDEHGARVDMLDDLVARTSPHLIYLTPTFHNPTGTVMPLERRATVARVAADAHVPVIENLSNTDLALDDLPGGQPPAIASLDANASVFSVGSMSKLFWGGLRIGWIRGPEATIGGLLSSKTVADLGSPVLSQLVAARLLERTDEVVVQRRAQLTERRDHMLAALARRLPEWELARPAGGLSLWVHLPYGNADEFADLAARHGVTVVPGPALSVDEGNRRALRLAFTQPPAVLDEGVRRLAVAWERYTPAESRPVRRLLV